MKPPQSQPAPRWESAVVAPNATIGDAARNLTESSLRVVLVVDNECRLVGTISDGDIRRGLLRGLTLDSPISEIICRSPFVVPAEMPTSTIRELMTANRIHQIPEVDNSNRVVGLHLWDDEVSTQQVHDPMVIMAGGKGSRLRPYTEDCPKPMLEVNGKPMLQHIIERARNQGFYNFFLAVNYLAHKIEDFFEDGRQFNVQINYLRETTTLGTAGALSLLPQALSEHIVVTNGDIITDVNYSDVLAFHKRQSADATMVVRLHEWKHPFGVVRVDGSKIIAFEEKPVMQSYINAGVYALSKKTVSLLELEEFCDMPELFQRARSTGLSTLAYPMHETWIDVGRHDDLLIANSWSRLK
jgi:dTDP-glucose pyrophosphorylase